MKASDIIQRLQTQLPKRTALFSTDITVTSLTRSGSTVTAVTGSAHGLVNDQEVIISGALELNPITSLTFLNGVAFATTQNNHDLTQPSAQQLSEDNILSFNQSTVSGAVEPEYNAAATILTAVNRKNFSYPITGAPSSPATGSPVLEQNFGYNGRFPVTIIDTVTFTYEITTTPESPAGGTIIARSPARISGAVSLDVAASSYTAQENNELWAFVVLGDVVTSRNRAILSDATNEVSKSDEYRNRLIEPFSVYVFVPSTDSLSQRDLRDDMEDIRGDIYGSLLGVVLPTALACATWSQITPNGDRYLPQTTVAAYIHEFNFERVVDVTYDDTKGPDSNSAFRDVNLNSTLNNGTGELTAEIDLDEQLL